MCLILFSYKLHSNYPLVIAANRDEFYQRPTAAAHFWPQAPDLLAGKDLQAGGSWMGVTRSGRFAAVTNYRDPGQNGHYPKSRGSLVADYLIGNEQAPQYLAGIDRCHSDFAGFSLLLGTTSQLFYYSNQQRSILELTPGNYGLSNGHLNEAWPKVVDGKQQLQQILQTEVTHSKLFTLLGDRTLAADSALPNTGVAVDMEKALSAKFIQVAGYGTRSSTVITVDQRQQLLFSEQTFDDRGQPAGSCFFRIELARP
jgi:uncharacterized protein with NRDE domain